MRTFSYLLLPTVTHMMKVKVMCNV